MINATVKIMHVIIFEVINVRTMTIQMCGKMTVCGFVSCVVVMSVCVQSLSVKDTKLSPGGEIYVLGELGGKVGINNIIVD